MLELSPEAVTTNMPGLPLQTEWSLLLAACSDASATEKNGRLGIVLSYPIRWDVLLRLAQDHGVLPILAHALSDVADRVSGEALRNIKEAYQANLHKTLLLSREFVRIVDCLSQADIEFVPYKGAALAETLYGDIAMRQSGDIDLLIHPADLKRVREAVAALGYIPHQTLSTDEEAAYLRSGYECVFDGPAGKNLLEVQWAIQPRFYAVDLEKPAEN